MLFKVTGPNGESIHGGTFACPLPKDGNPGEWAPDKPVDMCGSGYHLTSDVPRWWEPGARIWEAEGRDESRTRKGQSCFTSVRLMREITDVAELATLHVFVSGAWEIGCGKAVAYGSATVRAYGSATVEAHDSATVEAFGSATVEAFGSATVEAYDSATVEAYDSATVEAYDSATVISRQAKPNVKLAEKAVHVARGDGTAKPKIHVARKEK